jgi:hypothetical protein
MNLFVLCGDGAINRKKMTKTLHHALCAMMQFPVIWGGGDTPSPNQKRNPFLKSKTRHNVMLCDSTQNDVNSFQQIDLF